MIENHTEKSIKNHKGFQLFHVVFWGITIGFVVFFIYSQIHAWENYRFYEENYVQLDDKWLLDDTKEQVAMPIKKPSDASGEVQISRLLPTDINEKDYLFIRGIYKNISVYIDGQLRTSNEGNPSYEEAASSTRLLTESIVLSRQDSGKKITISYQSKEYKYAVVIGEVGYGTEYAFFFKQLKSGFTTFVLAIAILFIGLALIGLALFLRLYYQWKNPIHHLGSFALFIAFWIINEAILKQFYFPNLSVSSLLTIFTLGIGTIPLLLFFNQLQQGRYQKQYYVFATLCMITYCIVTFFHFTQLYTYMGYAITILFMEFGAVVVFMVTSLVKDMKKGRSKIWGKSLFIGLGVFGLFILLERISILFNPLQTRGIFTSMGVLILLFSLSYSTIRTLATQYIEQNNALIESHRKETLMKNRLQKSQRSIILGLANLIECRDSSTGHHVKNTSIYVRLLAEKLVEDNVYTDTLSQDYIEMIVSCAPLHDIGKILVPDQILRKPGKLTEDEFAILKNHASEGGRILQEVLGEVEDPAYLAVAVEIATHHHERWDGTGYPHGLAGREIPLAARIMSVADVFDALRSKRAYKEKLPDERVFAIIEEESGTHFDPKIVETLLRYKEDFIKVVPM